MAVRMLSAFYFACIFRLLRELKKAPESCDPGAPVENGFKPRSFLPAAAFYPTSVRVKKNTDKLVDFSALLLRTRLFCRSLVPFQAPPFSDGGLFSSTLRVKRQAPPLPCFVLDKKLTIPCCYCGCRLECRSGCLRGQYGWPIFAGRLVGLAGCAVKGYTPGDSCGPNPRRLYCARCKQGV